MHSNKIDIENNYRYEKKFVIPNSSSENLESFIDLCNLGFINLFKPRQVTSIYYDTPNFLTALDNINGSRKKRKIRSRFYGNDFENNKVNLEFKIREGNSGTKRIFELKANPKEIMSFHSLHEIAIKSEIDQYICDSFISFDPVLICTYKRYYYISICGDYRITIDKKIQYSNFNFCNSSNLGFNSLIDDLNQILELKYSIKKHEGSEEITNQWPFRSSSHSKYIQGLKITGLI